MHGVMDGCMYMEKRSDEMLINVAVLTTSLLQTLSEHPFSTAYS